MTPNLDLTLVHARSLQEQQDALDAWLRAWSGPAAAQAEALGDVRGGPADERQLAVVVEGASFALKVPEDVQVSRIAAGCGCCVGQVPLRVAIARSARTMDATRARALLLMVGHGEHLPRLREQIERGELGRGIRLQQ